MSLVIGVAIYFVLKYTKLYLGYILMTKAGLIDCRLEAVFAALNEGQAARKYGF
jgi:hypothetical protein